MDNKYGRIFTETDVEKIIELAVNDTEADLNALADQAGVKFPVSEPLFVIRAQDQLAPQAVANYLAMSNANGVNSDQLELVARTVNDIKAFQRDNADRVKLPD